MSAKKVDKNTCMCHHGHGWKMLLVGAIVTYNAYNPFISWAALIGILIALKGLLRMIMPCNCK